MGCRVWRNRIDLKLITLFVWVYIAFVSSFVPVLAEEYPVPAEPVTLSGSVKDRFGNALAGINISLEAEGFCISTTTDANGYYSLKAAPGHYAFRLQYWGQTNGLAGFDSSFPLDLTADRALDVVLPIVILSVKVANAQGQPIDGVSFFNSPCDPVSITITGLGQGWMSSCGSGITDSSGWGQIIWPGPITIRNLVFRPPTETGFVTTTLQNVSVTNDQTITVTLSQPVTLSGSVKDRFGNALAGINISLEAEGFCISTTTDANGYYSLKAAPGHYAFRLQYWGQTNGLAGFDSSFPLDLTADRALDVVLPIVILSVKVANAQGQPIDGVSFFNSPCDPVSITITGLGQGWMSSCGSGITDSSGWGQIIWPGPITIRNLVFRPPTETGFASVALTDIVVGANREITVILTGAFYNPKISVHSCSPAVVTGHAGTVFTFFFRVENQGTRSDKINVTFQTAEPGLELSLSAVSITLDPSASALIVLEAKVSKAISNRIIAIASSSSDSTKTDQCLVSYSPPDYTNPLFFRLSFRALPEGSSLSFSGPDYVKISTPSQPWGPINIMFDPTSAQASLKEFRITVRHKQADQVVETLDVPIKIPDCTIIATDFKVNLDGYSFDNQPWFTIPVLDISVLGWCYGFAETSILYYNWWCGKSPSSCPPQLARTYQLPSSQDVWHFIKLHFFNQLRNPDTWRSISSAFVDERREVEQLRQELQNGEPMIICLRVKPGYVKQGHAVVAYKLVQIGNELFFVTYDNNVHYTESFAPETFPCLKYNLSTGEFDFPGYGKLLTFTASKARPLTWLITLFECPLTVKITDQYGRTISDAGINEIPGAEFLALGEAKAFYLPLTLEYHVEIQGTKSGTFNFTMGLPYGETLSILGSPNIPITENTRAYMNITPGVADYTISIDFNGDGLVDEERKPDFKMTTEIRGNTPAGRDVEVSFLDQGVNIVFSNVYMAGHTMVTATDEFPFDLPIGIKFLKFYRFDTTAQYTGPITIQIKYDDTGLSPDEENKLRLFKIAPKEAPNDITTNLDTRNNVITGTTDTLSYFALGYQLWGPPTGTVIKHGPNPVPAEGCIFWLALPADTVSATLKIYAVDGALLVSIPLDPTADHYPPVGRWVPQDSNGRLLGTGLYLYLVEIHHADGRVTYSPLQKMVIKR
jgi:hypothetical protein